MRQITLDECLKEAEQLNDKVTNIYIELKSDIELLLKNVSLKFDELTKRFNAFEEKLKS